jgi:hydroxyacyl-ACP dehydratase HTD2-like protein with hotdog domain
MTGPAAGQRYFDDVEAGEQLPPGRHVLEPVQMFLFSSATSNAHRIHYDHRWAQSEGYPDIVVHGPLQSALMARLLTDWAGPRGQLVRINVRYQAAAFAGEVLVFTAEVVRKYRADGQALVDLRLAGTRDGGEVLMPGTATVRLPCRDDPKDGTT